MESLRKIMVFIVACAFLTFIVSPVFGAEDEAVVSDDYMVIEVDEESGPVDMAGNAVDDTLAFAGETTDGTLTLAGEMIDGSYIAVEDTATGTHDFACRTIDGTWSFIKETTDWALGLVF